mmetsp:Transcript_111539/g.197566  ORF Transcript_111539/g.197566 Transcript_111539/m.197566 type:complete len:374 (-) Transcript_111539:13-1134(-)
MSLQTIKFIIVGFSVHSALGVVLRGAEEGSPTSLDTAEDQLDKIDLLIKEGGSTTQTPNALVAPSLDSSTLSISDLLASAKWPVKGSYDQALSSVMTGAAADSCAAPLLARSRLSPWGMGAHLNQFANEVELAVYSGKPIALCAPEGVRDAWAVYFEDPGFSKCGQCDWGAGPRQYREMGWDVSDSSDHAKMADVKRFLYQKLFTLKPDAKMAVDAGLQSLGLSGSYIGVHVRRGDKSQEVPMVPLERFTAAIQDMHSTLGTSTIFLATDDATVHSALQQQLGSSYTIVEQKRLPDEAYQLRGDASRSMVPPFGEEEEEKSVLTDVAALVGAAGFIGTASSNIDRLVYFQRDSSLPSMSLDEGGLEGFITLSR